MQRQVCGTETGLSLKPALIAFLPAVYYTMCTMRWVAAVTAALLLPLPVSRVSRAADAPRKFDIPVWHPDARWQLDPEPFAGTILQGELDGPRRQVMWRWALMPEPCTRITEGGRYVCLSYDAATERYHVVAGSARGYLDGPFTRARFGGSSYSTRGEACASPDGRYLYIIDAYNQRAIRVLDLEKQEVRTIMRKAPAVRDLVVHPDGRLLVVNTGELLILTPDGALASRLPLEMKERDTHLSFSAALDEVHNRLYATQYRAENWYVWYWDLKDGSFHGVLPRARDDEPKRKPNEAGPFKGTNLYNEGAVAFGPDDPEKRFLYLGRVDTDTFFRLDLEKEEIWAFSADDGRFISSGAPRGKSSYGKPPLWLPDGSFMWHTLFWEGNQVRVFRRIR